MERNAVTMHIVKTTIVFVIMVTMETHIWNAKVGNNNNTVLFHSLVIGYDGKLNWFGVQRHFQQYFSYSNSGQF